MKKLSILLTLLFCFTSVWGHDVTVDGIYYNLNKKDTTASVTYRGGEFYYYDEYAGEVVIPSTISVKGILYQVTELEDNCFRDCEELTAVSIPNSITYIGNDCFEDCKRLVSIAIPHSVTSLGDNCFKGCTNLASVILPETVTRLGSGCFYNCDGLETITLPNSITTLESVCFCGCTALTSITIPHSVTNLGNGCFEGCTALTAISIPNSVSKMSESCFRNCINLASIVVEKGNPTYDSREGCNAIIHSSTNTMIIGCKLSTIPSSVTKLGNYCFADCTGLTSIAIPNSVKDIGYCCFYGCTGLTSISISNAVTSIKSSCFYRCEKLTSIEIPHSVTSLEQTCFSGCVNLTSISLPNSLTYLEQQCFENCTSLDSMAIPQGISQLPYGCFLNCTGLKSVVIPNSVTSVYSNCFRGCNNLSTIYCYPVPYLEYTKQAISFPADATVKLYGGPICELTLQKATPTTLTVGTNLNKNFISDGNDTLQIADITVYTDNAEPDKLGDNLYKFTGLNVETRYNIGVRITYNDGNKGRISNGYSTTYPTLNILEPKCVSSSCAIAAAMTNLDDSEKEAGFQWEKDDTPESWSPYQSFAAIYDGKLEGSLKDLETASKYKVRAFYRSRKWEYYYSDWVTFDPSNFSYFEPTVHTYPVTHTTDYTASLRGYALAGTDEITEQGFEYWEAEGGAAAPKQTKAAALAPAEENIYTVLASGQVMKVVLDGLKPHTSYICRAFVRTGSGTTYGEEQSFTTGLTTGIDFIQTEAPAPTIVGYYDLSGRKLAGKQRGLVIVRYSDGSSRKMIVK